MLLSIVIPTYNRSSSLEHSLAILKNDIGDNSDTEIHVVDDHSDQRNMQNNQSICKKSGVHYHWCTQNRGPAHARNIGLHACKGEWIAFLDDDIYIEKRWYSCLKSAIKNVDDSVLGIEGATRSSGNGLWDKEVENLRGGLFLSSNIVYRREIMIRCGGFDESFSGPYAEDQELALRIRKWGDIRFEKNLVVYHEPRRIKLMTYIFESFYRMKMLLDAEYYFYMKHRDRYHTCRYAATFWRGLVSILFKYTFTTLKRRKLVNIIKHPVQAVALLIGAFSEQCASWLYTPLYVIKYITNETYTSNIDWRKSAELLKLDLKVCRSFLKIRPNIIRALLFRFRRVPVYNAAKKLRKIKNVSGLTTTRLFLRVDDVFFDDIKTVELFCEYMEKDPAPFLAAVTGEDLTNESHSELLCRIVNAGGTIGQHGFTHSGTFGPYQSEILQMNFPDIDRMNAAVANAGLSEECRPYAFIPPFNAISWEQIIYLSKNFPVICGGPESARFTNYCFGPVILDNGSVYFPSFYPFYGQSAHILYSGILKRIGDYNSPICITVHLPEESRDNYKSLMKCINMIRPFLTDWSDILSGLPRKSEALIKS